MARPRARAYDASMVVDLRIPEIVAHVHNGRFDLLRFPFSDLNEDGKQELLRIVGEMEAIPEVKIISSGGHADFTMYMS